ncbi:hypothetical protein DUNSADRAFT_6118 [Dunaliella salina]|uniref:Uncharacterized protein n=1 Tax=Dunaliella salina TaxID=3046 RepID=A0ABQ7H719_DUNSA|nr:hypothetical protein DUNSADRAFT_6118 [Dunaliella salina]|eukprot:KAF5842648.1 hypothetical protein DUNSADRAFT_6118 [Dunaliella salina]
MKADELFVPGGAQELSPVSPDEGAQGTSWRLLKVNFDKQWGWADIPQCLFDDKRAEEAKRLHPLAFAEALSTSRAYHSPHCATALSEHCGLQQLHDGMDSVCITGLGNEQLAEGVRDAVKQRINAAWATEAIKQGVQHSKSGAYDEAHKCYAKAMELHPGNADAFVARGAAFANQGYFDSAIADFEHALSLDAQNANADKYLQAVRQRAASRRSELQARLQNTPPRVAPGASEAQPPVVSAAALTPGVPHKASAAPAGEASRKTHPVAAPNHQVSVLTQPNSPLAQKARVAQSDRWRRHKRSSSRASTDGSSSSSQDSEADSEHDNGKPGDVHRALQLVLEARKRAKGKKREKHKKAKHKKKKKKQR